MHRHSHPTIRPLRRRVAARLTAIALGSTLLLVACAAAPPPAVDPPPVATTGDAVAPDAYRLGVGDVLHVAVWKDSDLDVTAPIAPDGHISLPLLGEVQAAGKTLAELRRTLTDQYSKFVTSPTLLVVLNEIHSRKVFVTGEVKTPGAYDLTDSMRVMQAIAVAGGLTPYAKRHVVVLRASGASQQRLPIDLGEIVGGNAADNLLLQPGDTIVVP